jgi:UDP-GlcNAc:undecaprenyl-phosphate GlcNAc-1-phosphate transferase
VVQVIAAAVLVTVGFRLFTGVSAIDSLAIVSGILSLVFMVGMLSSVNLIDGHDGLAAGIALIASSAFAVIGMMDGATGVVAASLAIGGACLGFLLFNFPPARIYMGDTGSMLLGLMLALISCLITMRAPSVGAYVGVLLVLGVPVLDTLLAVARRVALRAPLFAADHLHVHHVLRQAGLSARKTLLLLYGLQASLAGLGVAAAAGNTVPAIMGLVVLAVAFVTFFRAMMVGHALLGSATSAARHAASAPLSFQPKFNANLQERRTSVGR